MGQLFFEHQHEPDYQHEPPQHPSDEAQQEIDGLRRQLAGSRAEAAKLSARLQSTMQQQERFVSLMAHDLRNPLTVISGYTQIMDRQPERPLSWRVRSVKTMVDQEKKLQRMIEEVLQASRLAAGQIEISRSRADLVAIAREVAEKSPMNDTHYLVVDHFERPLPVMVDSELIVSVMENLLLNAVQNSPGGEVRVSVMPEGDHAVVAVEDHGPGIDPVDVPLLFSPFTRLTQATERHGMGLGLYISKVIVEMHGGTMWAESRLGSGSTFSFRLPLAGPERQDG